MLKSPYSLISAPVRRKQDTSCYTRSVNLQVSTPVDIDVAVIWSRLYHGPPASKPVTLGPTGRQGNNLVTGLPTV